jgi:hypothetical protein
MSSTKIKNGFGLTTVPTVASKKKTVRQNHALTQWKMLYCKTVLNIITYHHVV